MRLCLLVASTFALTACGGVDYRDNHAAVDGDPLCVSRADQPGEPQSRGCTRTQETIYRSDRGSAPVDFRKRGDHDFGGP